MSVAPPTMNFYFDTVALERSLPGTVCLCAAAHLNMNNESDTDREIDERIEILKNKYLQKTHQVRSEFNFKVLMKYEEDSYLHSITVDLIIMNHFMKLTTHVLRYKIIVLLTFSNLNP